MGVAESVSVTVGVPVFDADNARVSTCITGIAGVNPRILERLINEVGGVCARRDIERRITKQIKVIIFLKLPPNLYNVERLFAL